MGPKANRQQSQASADDGTVPAAARQPLTLPAIEKLKGPDNWCTWKMLMETLLFHDGAAELIKNPPNAEEIQDQTSELYELDARARARIIFSVEPQILQYLSGSTTAYGHWTKLSKVFEDSGVYRRTAIKRQLFALRQGSRSLTEYVMAHQDLVGRLSAMGHPIDQETAAFLLLEHVGEAFKPIAQILERTALRDTEDGGTEFNYEKVIDDLLREGVKAALKAELSASKALKAGAPRHHQRRQHGGKSRGRFSNGYQGDPSSSGSGQHGGGSSGSGQHGGGSSGSGSSHGDSLGRGQYGGSSGSGHHGGHQQSTSVGKYPLCKWCKNPLRNHPEKDCFFNPDNPRSRGFKRGHSGASEGPAEKRRQTCVNNSSPFRLKNLMAKMSVNDDEEPRRGNKNLEIYIDSGAFSSMCNDKNLLHNYKNTKNKKIIECAGDQVLHTEGTGTLKLKTGDKNKLEEIEDMIYVPNLSSNLLSVSSVAKNGFVVVFRGENCGIYCDQDVKVTGEPLLTTKEEHGTYKINVEVSQNLALKTTSDREADTWHKRFGHLGKSSFEMLKTGMVRGLPNKTLKPLDSCETCVKSKQVRASFPKTGATRAKEVLEIIHSDVCEVTDGTTWDGDKYLCSFIDDKSRFTVVFPLKTKNEVFEKFKEFKRYAEKQTGKSIKILRSDNGGEYKNHYFDQYLKEEGILRQYSVAGTPEQNGVAERANRTLMEKVRAMLDQSGLDHRFWGEALRTATYLKNLSPTKAVPGMVPFEAWTGTKPDVKGLRIFGCCAYVHVPKSKSKKLGDRGKMCVFIGYDDEKKGWRLVDLARPREVIVEASVFFMEHRFPALEVKTTNEASGFEGETPTNQEVIVCEKPVRFFGANKNHSLSRQSSSASEYSTTSISRLSDDVVSTSTSSSVEDRSPSSDRNNAAKIKNPFNLENKGVKNYANNRRIKTPRKFDDFLLTESKRIKTKNYARLAASTDDVTPTNLGEALKCAEADFWIRAMTEELNSFEENGVWSLVPHRARENIVGTKWVYKRKIDSAGKVLFRARLVAKGYTQTYGVDYHETYAPVVRRTTLRLLFSTAVNFDLRIDHLDVKTAFLYGDLAEAVYLAQPEGFSAPGQENKVCKLHKAMYGLKQAANSWYQKADSVLKNLGFKNFHEEPCVYIKNTKNSVVIIALYVDDFYLFYNNKEDKEKLLHILNSHFKTKDLGEAKNCLGIVLERDWKDGSMVLHQRDYAAHVLQKFDMLGSTGLVTPLEHGLKLNRVKEGKNKTLPYQELIGSLLYLSVNTRPDIAYAVSFLGQFNSCYTTVHWTLAKGVLQYVKNTINKGLKYTKAERPGFCLTGYADADFAGDTTDFKSYSGYCFTFDKNLISWESKKQKFTAQSTTESEYISLTAATKESLWLNELVSKLFGCGKQTVRIYNDNQSAITLAYSHGYSARTKHMGVRIQLVRDCVKGRLIHVEHMPTDLMPADILTKALKRDRHETGCQQLKMSE